MSTDLTCPRCPRPVQPPGLRSSRFTCAQHGEVAPLHPAVVAENAVATALAARAQVPVWLPWPLPRAWLVTGLRVAGDDHSGWLATVVAISGPNPLAVPGDGAPLVADLLVVAEQPGVGLGARLAGREDVDPGPVLVEAMAATGRHAVVEAAGHCVPLWAVPGAVDRAVYVGEAASVWLWLVARPPEGGAITLEHLRLVDLRRPDHELDLPAGALSASIG